MAGAPSIPSDPRVVADLRAVLLRNADAMRAALGPAPNLHQAIDAAVYERRLRTQPSDAAALAQFFTLGKPVAAARLERAVDPLSLRDLEDMRLAVVEHSVIRPLARITQYQGILVASDVPREPQPHDFVAGTNSAAERLAQLTIRTHAGRALDLGTGCGVQALLAAAHCDRTIGVDLNRRALAMARFNAALNGIRSIEFREGSWFAPVAGEKFDLIVANPPYVISPDNAVLYRDGGLPGDAVTLKVLRETASYLEEGGFAQVAGNWVHSPDGDWRDPLEAAIDGSGCDALFLHYATVDPPRYAAHWNAARLVDGGAAFVDAVDRWLEYYDRHNIEAISDGCLVLRKRSAPTHWVQAIEVPGAPGSAAGDHIRRLFDARDRRDALADDERLRSTRLARAPGFKVVTRATDDGLAQRRAAVEIEDGIGFSLPVSAEVEALLYELDGARTLGELPHATPERFAGIRRLHALGLLVSDVA